MRARQHKAYDLYSLDSVVAGSQGDQLRWEHTGGQGHGTQALVPHYSSFTITGFTQTGDTTNGSTTVANLNNAVRPRPGMTVTGTGIPASTTVVSVNRTASSMVISNAATATGTGVTLTFSGDSYDPVITFGYNSDGTGEIVSGEGRAVLQIEGHYHRDTDDVALMEIFFDFRISGATGSSRPIGAIYDKVAKKVISNDLIVGQTNAITFHHEDYSGAAASASYEFYAGEMRITADPVRTLSNHTRLILRSQAGYGSNITMTTDGDNGSAAVQMLVSPNASDNNCAITMTDSAATPATKNGISIFAPSSLTSVTMSIGQSAGNGHSMLFVTNTSGYAALKCLTLTCAASQTAPAFEIDGIQDGGTAEGDKFQIYPKGYIAVKPSGGAATTPTTGANSVTLPTTNCPGTGTSTKWFPLLDTAGALYWIPAVSAA